jgi:uracil phosphoribosyltransferase
MIRILDNPIVRHFLTNLRNKNTSSPDFRKSVKILGACLAVEACKSMEISSFDVETPLETTTGYKLKEQIVLFPILRAGLGLLDSFLDILPMAVVGYHGLKRNEATHEIMEYYYSAPEISTDTRVLILDPMIATGNSICSSMESLQMSGAERISVCSLIAAPQGIEKILTEFPNTEIITCALDRDLNDRKYIVPGLGDAGDRLNGY